MAHLKKACQKKKVTIKASDLPLCCPLPGEDVWNAHPRVYLTLDDNNQSVCPYCSTVYELKDK